MKKKSLRLVQFILIGILLTSVYCAGRPDPRETVKDFFEAVEKSDTSAIQSFLDLDSLAQEKLKVIITQDSVNTLEKLKEGILHSLIKGGNLRVKWENSLIVVGDKSLQNNHAQVEVTFVNQNTGSEMYTKMRLYYTGNRWKIYSFGD